MKTNPNPNQNHTPPIQHEATTFSIVYQSSINNTIKTFETNSVHPAAKKAILQLSKTNPPDTSSDESINNTDNKKPACSIMLPQMLIGAFFSLGAKHISPLFHS